MRVPLSNFVGSLAVVLTLLQQTAGAQSDKPATQKSDRFSAGSVWVDDTASLRLTVFERDGDTFRGKLVAGDSVERTFTGTVKDGQVAWLAKDVEATKGGQGGDNTGTINGDRIDFKYRSDAATGEFTLRRQRKPAAGQRRGRDAAGNRSSKPPTPSLASVVKVDFGDRIQSVKSMSGFLHGITTTQPPDDRIQPLQPALWRITSQSPLGFERVARMGIPMIHSPSDTWNHAVDPSPYHDYPAWDAHVRDVVRVMSRYEHVQDKNFDLVWDVWNEPDNIEFWRGTEEQFHETFRRAGAILRTGFGADTRISGPCITRYDVAYITRFLDFCAAENITLDVLSWHELGVDANIPTVTEHLRDARRRFVDNPAYRKLGIRRIHINESVGPSAQYLPGEILAYLDALEQGGADGACKACWGDSGGALSCFNATLDGILTPETYEPRAAWWAYKAYAASVSTRVRSASSDRRLVSFASRGDDRSSPQIVIGYFALGDSPHAADVNLRLQNVGSIPALGRLRSIRVRIERIPDSGEEPVPQLEVVREETLRIADGAAEFRLSSLGLHEGCIITLEGDR